MYEDAKGANNIDFDDQSQNQKMSPVGTTDDINWWEFRI